MPELAIPIILNLYIAAQALAGVSFTMLGNPFPLRASLQICFDTIVSKHIVGFVFNAPVLQTYV